MLGLKSFFIINVFGCERKLLTFEIDILEQR